MNKTEAIKKLNDAEIFQLRKGETLSDALDYLDGKLVGRKGYQFKTDCGRLLSKNEIITASNKEAFSKSVRTPEYKDHDLVNVDKSKLEDYREDMSKEGIVQPCQYCGTPLLTDDIHYDILNCENCMGYAVLKNCM